MATGTGVRDRYNIAINGRGYMLRGSPNTPAYRHDEVPTQVSRLAISDLQYSDFAGSGNFFTAQTDWSGGIKADKVWKDDAKFYYSTNIDVYSDPGAFKLHKQLATQNDFSEDIYCGAIAEVGGSTNMYVGTTENVSSYPQIYKYASGSWSAVAATTFGTGQNIVSQVSGHKGLLVASIVGLGNNYCLGTWTGSAWTDHSAAIRTALSWSASTASRCHTELAGTLYAGFDDSLNDKTAIVSTVDAGATWVKEVEFATNGLIVDMIGYNGLIYYLLVNSVYTADFRVFDPTTNGDTSVYTFYNVSYPFYGCGGRFIHNLGGSLIITVPNSEIYSFDGSTMKRIFYRDPAKNAIGTEADCSLNYGGMVVGTKIIWGNLVYDGTSFYNNKKDSADNTANYYIPQLLNSADISSYLGYSTGDRSILLQDDSNYKGTLAKNFLVFSEMSPVVSIDKLLSTITLVFDALAANENIAAEYSINGGSSWTALTTMTSTTEGTNTSRNFTISSPTASILYKKLFVRVKLAGTTTTPTVRDVIVGFKPIPDYKNRWQMRMEMSDGVTLLNKQESQLSGRDLNAALWAEKNNKSIVRYEDLDYAECQLMTSMTAAQTSALVDSTKNLPPKGRIRAVSGGVAEEMIYTSSTPRKLLGITRGQRGTRARAYLSGQVLKNDYDVYIQSVQSEVNWTDEKKTENIGNVVLIEA